MYRNSYSCLSYAFLAFLSSLSSTSISGPSSDAHSLLINSSFASMPSSFNSSIYLSTLISVTLSIQKSIGEQNLPLHEQEN